MSETPDTSLAVALGELKGTVTSLIRILEEQNKTFAKNREEQNAAAAKSRDEFMAIFQGMRDDNKEQTKAMQEHIQEDNLHHNATLKLVSWKEDVSPKINTLWDAKNREIGIIMAITTLGGIVGGAIAAAIEYFRT